MKILIAGLGSIGRRHLRNLLALGERDILLYRTHQSSLPEEDLQGFPVETDLQAALAQRPQAMVIANPTALHLQVAIPAARAGCSILMEKPISHTLEGVEELEQALQQGGGRLLCAYHFRFHPGLRHAGEIIRSGELGRVLSFHACWGEYLPGWHPWEDYRSGYAARPDLGGGVVLTLSHPLDYLRWLLGEVTHLWAFTSNAGLGLPVEDSAEIGLHMQGGATGSVHLDYHQRPARHTLQVVGTHGSLDWDYHHNSLEVVTAEGQASQKFTLPADFERNHLYLDEMRHFLKVVHGEELPLCTLQDGVQALKLALGALRSAREGCLVEMEQI